MGILDGDVSKNELFSWILLPILLWSLSYTWIFLALFGTIYAAWFIYQQFYKSDWINSDGKIVYITGCDSGFGKEAALELARVGFTVCAGCLNPENCQDLLVDSSSSGKNIHVLDLDVSDEKKVNACAEYVQRLCVEKGGALWALYNNAGYATAGEVEWTPMHVYQRQMDVNFWGTVRVTKSVLPLIRKAKGRVLTIVSGIGRPGCPGRSAYSVSKAAQETFMDCLRYEMRKFGVKCITLLPGNFTGATSVFSRMPDHVKSIIDQIPAEVKQQAYGDEYLKRFYSVTIEGYKASANPSIAPMTPVVDAIKHAIMSENPRVRYKPAQLRWFVWWFCSAVLPDQMTDLYVRFWLRNLPKPASALSDQD